MKSWTLPADATTADELVLADVPLPEPGPGQVRLRARGLSINARDRMVLAGPFGRLAGADLVPLSDVAGEIDAVGQGVGTWAVGDRVTTAHVSSWTDGLPVLFGPGPGSLDDPGVAAEHVLVSADVLVRTPAHLDDAEAATLQVAGVTAWNSLFGAHPATAGQRVLVLGSGGVAVAAAQLALAAGAEVHAAVRGSTDDPRWTAIGTTSVLSTDDPGWGQRFADATGGAHKIVNAVGPGLVPECLDAAAPGAEVAVPGLLAMQPQPLDALTLISKQASVRGVAVGSIAMHRRLSEFVARHELHPVIDTRIAFDRLPDAYAALERPDVFGKVVIDVA